MPELPDVEGFRRYLARHAQGRRILSVDVPDTVLVRNRSPQAFGRALEGKRFGAPQRHGKWLIAPAGDVQVLLHFGMTGLLRWAARGAARHPHDRVIFVCEGGELRYNNMRRFGGVWLARDEEERSAVTGPLGPDAAELDRDTFDRLLLARRGGVKAALMDQRLVAGVGNLLSDEILWRARLRPPPCAVRGDACRGGGVDSLRTGAPRGAVADASARRPDGRVSPVRDAAAPRDRRGADRLLVPPVSAVAIPGARAAYDVVAAAARWRPRAPRRMVSQKNVRKIATAMMLVASL